MTADAAPQGVRSGAPGVPPAPGATPSGVDHAARVTEAHSAFQKAEREYVEKVRARESAVYHAFHSGGLTWTAIAKLIDCTPSWAEKLARRYAKHFRQAEALRKPKKENPWTPK